MVDRAEIVAWLRARRAQEEYAAGRLTDAAAGLSEPSDEWVLRHAFAAQARANAFAEVQARVELDDA